MIEFSWPWIFLLLPLPALAFIKYTHASDSNSAIDIPPGLSRAIARIDRDEGMRTTFSLHTIRLTLLALAWFALLTAIAQPFKPEAGTAQPASGRAIALLIDLSTSMERRDFSIDSEAVDRLTVVKKIASEFIVNRIGDRLSLVLFGSEAFIASPLSYDLNAVNTILQSSGIGMAGRTTAMGDALGLAIKSLREDNAASKAIVLLSDGTNNAGTAEPEDAAQLAASLGIVVHTIGLGSEASNDAAQQFQSASADLDEATLKSIATQSGGEFFRAHTSDELAKIYSQIDTLQSTDAAAPALIIKRDIRNIFILIALLFVVIVLLLERAGRTT